MSEKPVKTETTVKTFDAEGNMLTETVTTVVRTDTAGGDDAPGLYI